MRCSDQKNGEEVCVRGMCQIPLSCPPLILYPPDTPAGKNAKRMPKYKIEMPKNPHITQGRYFHVDRVLKRYFIFN